VTVSKAGFLPFEQPVSIQGGSDLPLSVQLSPERHVARLVVSADQGATIVVDGSTLGKGRLDAQVASGAHAVEVTEPGKTPYRAQVDLRDDETRALDVTLVAEKHPATLWPWIAGGAAVVAGAAVGSYFLFKSSPDNQAPLSGTFGAVRFTSSGSR
jgi:hypothetical protein